MPDPQNRLAENRQPKVFLHLLQEEASRFAERISTEDGDWIVRGFIDVFRRVYTISGDTKVVSKLIELMLLPMFRDFAETHGFTLFAAREQNHYPDLSFQAADTSLFAVDLKSTYRTSTGTVNGFTLGAYSGYFRDRHTIKNTTFPYSAYSGHFVLGVIYDRSEVKADELQIHSVRELSEHEPIEVVDALKAQAYSVEAIQDIPSVVRQLQFFAQPKWRIASDVPGSGNTRNIGSTRVLSQLLDGSGPFAPLGEHVFDAYYQEYMTRGDAKGAGLAKPPYRNLREYAEHKKAPAGPDAFAEAIAASSANEKLNAGRETEESV